MVKAFTNPQTMLGANLDREIAAMEPLLAAAHERRHAHPRGLHDERLREQSLFDLQAKYADVVSLEEARQRRSD